MLSKIYQYRRVKEFFSFLIAKKQNVHAMEELEHSHNQRKEYFSLDVIWGVLF